MKLGLGLISLLWKIHIGAVFIIKKIWAKPKIHMKNNNNRNKK